MFFLGVPLVLRGQLYCLVEQMGGSICLLALDAETGRELWLQPLASVEDSVVSNLPRRMMAVTPSYSDGMIVCPTGAGVVVGFNLSSGTLSWAYLYEQANLLERYMGRRALTEALVSESPRPDSGAQLVDDRVWLSPNDSEDFHCLDLHSGKLLWKHSRKDPQGEEAFLLAVGPGGTALALGSNQVTALNPKDGTPVWAKPVSLPDGGVITGRGFVSGDRYYLPVASPKDATPRVVAVDMHSGKLDTGTPFRNSRPLGNLIAFEGAILSQDGARLERFDEYETLLQKAEKTLAHDPRDAQSLRTLGEIALDSGQYGRALDLLTRAWKAEPDSVLTREVLTECLLAALDTDFATYRNHLPTLRQLSDDPVVRPSGPAQDRVGRHTGVGRHVGGMGRLPATVPDTVAQASNTCATRLS